MEGVKREKNMRKRMLQIAEGMLLFANDVIILDKAWLGRTRKWEPLSKLYTSWMVQKRGNYWDIQPLLNLFLFSPMLFLLVGLFPDFFRKHKYVKALCIAFGCSLFIETAQLISCLGTFQISDLVYNTLSGAIGVWGYGIAVRLIPELDTSQMEESNGFLEKST